MSAFDSVRLILDFNQRALRPSRAAEPWDGRPQARFFWPALCRQLLVRERRATGLNIFQEYVLRLYSAGLREPDEISKKLLPPPELAGQAGGYNRLVVRILAELRLARAIDTTGSVTRQGHDMLSGAAQESEELASLYVFTDPWTGTVWDRFRGEIRSAMIDVTFRRADGRTMAQPAGGDEAGLVVRPNSTELFAKPEEAKIRRLYASYVRDWYLQTGSEEPEENDGQDVLRDAPSTQIGEIVSMDDEPQPVYLSTLAFIPPGPTRAGLWRVADPFGLGANDAFRARLDEFGRGEGEPLLTWLQAKVVPSPSDGGRDGLTREAEILFEKERIGFRLASHPALYEDLLSAQRAALASKRALEQNMKRDARDDVMVAIGNSQKALERTFKILAEKFPTELAYGRFDLVPGERQAGAAVLMQAAGSLKFDGGADRTLPPRFTHVDAGKIRYAADKHKGSLNALAWAAILTAVHTPDHPVAAAARKYPKMLFDLSRIAELRDEVSHAVSEPLAFKDEVDDVLAHTRRIIDLLLPF
jgi:hypothetical protein